MSSEFKFKASDVVKHSAAHVMAAAVKRIFPTVKIGVGPVTKTGFYYDFQLDRDITEDDLDLIEKNINQIIQEDLPFKRILLAKNEAYNMLLQIGQIFKAELVQAIPDDQVSFYKLGEEFIDLCRGPHVKSTNQIGIIKLTDVQYVNWNEDESRPRMSRVSGVVFQNIIEFNEYLEVIKKKEERSFVKFALNKNLMFKEGGTLMLTESGSRLKKSIREYIIEEFENIKPRPADFTLQTSFDSLNNAVDANFSNGVKSHKNLPLVYTSSFYTEEKEDKYSLTDEKVYFKVFSDSQDSILSIGDVLEKCLDMLNYITSEDYHVEIKCFDLDHVYVKSISSILQKKIISHNKVLTSGVGKNIQVDFKTTDSAGKDWTLGSMILEDKSNKVIYMNDEGNKVPASKFSLFFSLMSIFEYLLEENDLDIPFKFHPFQIYIIPKSNKEVEIAERHTNILLDKGYTVFCDKRSKSFKSKIKDAENRKAPFIFIIGKKEEVNQAVSVRHNNLEVGLVGMDNIDEFIQDHREN